MSGMRACEAYVSNFYGCGSGAVSAIAGNGAAVVPCVRRQAVRSACQEMQISRCPFRKFHPVQIRIVRQHHRIIESDVCDPARAPGMI